MQYRLTFTDGETDRRIDFTPVTVDQELLIANFLITLMVADCPMVSVPPVTLMPAVEPSRFGAVS